MKVYLLKREQFVPIVRDQVFAYFQEPGNLERLTPGKLAFQMLTPQPIHMHQGTVIDYTIRLGFIPVRWTTLISEYVPPDHFTDIQLKGPYAFWHHQHHFEESSEGTLIKDTVHYSLPLGIIGRLVHCFIVRRQLQNIFRYRHTQIEMIFSG